MTASPRPATGGLARGCAAVVIALRVLVLVGWLIGTAAAVLYLPPLTSSNNVTSVVRPVPHLPTRRLAVSCMQAAMPGHLPTTSSA